jgi:hypothetical protein
MKSEETLKRRSERERVTAIVARFPVPYLFRERSVVTYDEHPANAPNWLMRASRILFISI